MPTFRERGSDVQPGAVLHLYECWQLSYVAFVADSVLLQCSADTRVIERPMVNIMG